LRENTSRKRIKCPPKGGREGREELNNASKLPNLNCSTAHIA